MDFQAYEKIWQNSIKPQIDRMTSTYDDIVYTEGQVKEKIWLTYEDYKNKVHSYMHNPDGRIDRHKVASVMLYSIIINKPFELKLIPSKREVNSSALLANEIIGFHTALAIVWSFILSDANEKSDKNKVELFKDGFIFPKCQHDSYETNIYKMLYYSKYNECYDIFAFANILFLIEAYTEYVKKTELVGKVFS